MKVQRLVPMVTTDRMTECQAFYTTNFGCHPTFESPGYVGLRFPGGTEIGIMKPDADASCSYQGGVSFGLEVADVDAEHARLVAAGVPIVRPLQDNPWGDRSFMVNDPAGVGVYVHRPIALADEYKKYLKA
ncbi:MAG: VOC family protein [Deltaproteobacteria bacterium]|nr:VOC family protein [Deltaproteobacteria bacterium]